MACNVLICLWKSRYVLATAAIASLAAVPAQACIPGGAVRCAQSGALDQSGQVAPLTRADIDAMIDLPGPAATEAVRRDTARTWETIRRQSLPPAIAYPADPGQRKPKGDTP